jgi:hypothetical protein
MGIRKLPQWLLRGSSIVLALLLGLEGGGPCLMGQEASAPQIKIVILEGDGAINNIRQRTSREPIVQIEDENHKPVAGALVVFALPDSGAGGVFPGGSKSLMTYSDSKGQARARGYQVNAVAGAFQIKITASFKGMTAISAIGQTNVAAAAAAGAGAAAGGISAKVIAILAVAGAAAATGIVVATRKDTTPAPTTVSVGNPTVGRP